MCISCKTMGVTSLGPHTRPACNQALRGTFIKTNVVILSSIQCVFIDFGWCGGLGLNCACVSLVTRLRAVHKTMPSMWCSFSYGVTWLWCPNMGIATSSWSHGLYAWFWLVETKVAALWLVSTYCSLHHYSQPCLHTLMQTLLSANQSARTILVIL